MTIILVAVITGLVSLLIGAGLMLYWIYYSIVNHL